RSPNQSAKLNNLSAANTSPSVKRTAVGSGTGAVIRRQLLGWIGGFPLRARVEGAVIPFPVPAASHAACGFAALRAPAPFRGKGYEAVRPGAAASRGQWATRSPQKRPRPPCNHAVLHRFQPNP